MARLSSRLAAVRSLADVMHQQAVAGQYDDYSATFQQYNEAIDLVKRCDLTLISTESYQELMDQHYYPALETVQSTIRSLQVSGNSTSEKTQS